jgi:hypothetical protein
MPVKYKPWTIQENNIDAWGFIIEDGRYADTVISINDIKLLEDVDGVNLDYNVYKKPESLTNVNISEEQDFNNILQYIIEDIIKKAIDEHDNRKDSTSESTK